MDPKRVNLPAFLQNQGYYTSCIGKWHLGLDWTLLNKDDPNYKPKRFDSWKIDYTKPFRKGPLDIGFDEAYFISGSMDLPPYVYLAGDRAIAIPTTEKGWPHNEYNDFIRIGAATEDFDANKGLEVWANKATDFIGRQAQKKEAKPFFLYLPLTSPHTPITPGAAFKGRYPQYSMYADFIAETDWVVEQGAQATRRIWTCGKYDSHLHLRQRVCVVCSSAQNVGRWV